MTERRISQRQAIQPRPVGGDDQLRGGSGADVLVAVSGRRDHVDCGAGRDPTYVDRSDAVTRGERIEHRRGR